MKLNTPSQDGREAEPSSRGVESSNQGVEISSRGVETNNRGVEPSNKEVEIKDRGAEPVNSQVCEAHLQRFLSWLSEDHRTARRRRSPDAQPQEEEMEEEEEEEEEERRRTLLRQQEAAKEVKEEAESDREGDTEEEEELPDHGPASQEEEGAGLLPDWLRLSEQRAGKGSPLSERLRQLMVEQFQSGVPQRKIAKNLNISPSTVHNIIKRFRQSGQISVRKGQGRKPILSGDDVAALRRHRLHNKLQSVVEVTAWAQKTFNKPLSVNTVRRCIHKY